MNAPDGEVLNQSATTTTTGTPTVATGDSSNPLLGTWLVQPVAPDLSSGGHWVLASDPTCDASQPVTAVGPDQLQVDVGTATAPVVTCDFVYQLVAPSSLNLVKVLRGDTAAQSGAAIITATCDDGASATLTVAPGEATPAGLPTALSIPFPAVCQVAETANGATSAAHVTTTSAVTTNGSATQGALTALSVGSDTASVATVVTFTNTYSEAATARSGSQLAASGFTSADRTLALAGLLMALVGLVLVLAARPRRRLGD